MAQPVFKPLELLIGFGNIGTRHHICGGLIRQDEALHRIDAAAPGAGLDVEYPHCAPVIALAHIHHRIVEIDRSVIQPVGVIDTDLPRGNDFLHHCDMAAIRSMPVRSAT